MNKYTYESLSMMMRLSTTQERLENYTKCYKSKSTNLEFSLHYSNSLSPKQPVGASSGPTQGLSDGWFIMLEPLSPGLSPFLLYDIEALSVISQKTTLIG